MEQSLVFFTVIRLSFRMGNIPAMANPYRDLPFFFNGLGVLFSGWWFGTFFIFPYIGNFIITTDKLIFFRVVGIPPTSFGV
jgi:hypothetical protein